MSRLWSFVFRAMYRGLRLLDPLIRGWYRSAGLGNVIELRVRSRRSGGERSVLVGLLRAGDDLYLGHPDGHAHWTRDLETAGSGRLVWRHGPQVEFRAVRLEDGPERDSAILATAQHPFPGNLIYRLGRRHVRAAGIYFRLEPIDAMRAQARPADATR